MRPLLINFFLLLISTISNCQNSSNQLLLSNDSDTTFWKKYQERIFNETKEIQPLIGKQDYHFRIVYHGQVISHVIDLRKEDKSKYLLEIRFYTKENTLYNEEPTNRYYYEKIKYDSTISSRVHNLIVAKQIESIPSDKKIVGWSRGLDGIEITIETIVENKYSFKQYWTPSAQDTLKEGLAINRFIQEIWNLLEINSKEKDFASRIPFESYNTGGPETACRILTKRERRFYKKERKNYRQHVVKNIGVDARISRFLVL